MRPRRDGILAGVIAAGLAGCGGPGPQVSPGGDACVIEGPRTVLPASQPEAIRAALAKRQGVVAVAYDCKGLRVIPGCSAPEGYALVPVEPSDQAISLTSAGEVELNAPAPPGGEAVKAPWAEHFLTAGRAIARKRKIKRSDLRGTCDDATHVVRRMDVGTKIDVTTKSVECVSADGDLLPACSDAIRLYLEPIDGEKKKEERGRPAIACPQGAVPSKGKCEVRSAAAKAACSPAALDACMPDCEAGNPESCAVLGWSEMHDATKMVEGFKLSRAACEAGHETACGDAAMALAALEESEEAAKEIIALYSIGCGRGDSVACVELGAAFFSLKDPGLSAKAAMYFDRACDLGSAIGCGDLGLSVHAGKGIARDAGRAKALFEDACSEGEGRFCLELGAMLLTGEGGAQDLPRAKGLFEVACKGEQPIACMNLGSMYLEGVGVDQSFKRAEELLSKACEANVGGGCRLLGWMREEARGAPRDLPMAAGLYARGCTMGDATACSELGRMHFDGLGILRDEARAVDLFQKACDAGVGFACHNVAIALTDGRGVAKDPARATEFHKRACEAGMDRSCRMLESKKP